MTEEQINEYYTKKYATSANLPEGEETDAVYDDISQHGLLPSTKDPNLWIVKCRMGEEKLVAMQLMRKFLAYEHTDEVSARHGTR